MKNKTWVVLIVVIALSTVVFGITGAIVNTILQANQVNSGLFCDAAGSSCANLSACSNGEVLRYNSTTLKWTCGIASVTGGNSSGNSTYVGLVKTGILNVPTTLCNGGYCGHYPFTLEIEGNKICQLMGYKMWTGYAKSSAPTNYAANFPHESDTNTWWTDNRYPIWTQIECWTDGAVSGNVSSSCAPDYDSGWFGVTKNTAYSKVHGLGTTPVKVVVLQSNQTSGTPTTWTDYTSNVAYGANWWQNSTHINVEAGQNWAVYSTDLSSPTPYVGVSGQYRVLAWKDFGCGGTSSNSPAVYFEAYKNIGGVLGSSVPPAKIDWNLAPSNIGSGFDLSSDVFTVPVTGNYYIEFAIRTSGYASKYIYVNGVNVKSDSGMENTISSILDLNEGDTVSVYAKNEVNDGNGMPVYSDNQTTYFKGILLNGGGSSSSGSGSPKILFRNLSSYAHTAGSIAWRDIPGMNITDTFSAGIVYVTSKATISVGAPTNPTYAKIRILVDGVEVDIGHVYASGANYGSPIVLSYTGNLNAGIHSIALQSMVNRVDSSFATVAPMTLNVIRGLN